MIRPALLDVALVLGRGQAWAADRPKFSACPADAVYAGPAAPARLAGPDEKQFRTRIRDGARSGVNFGGHYNLIEWGCGTPCAQGAVFDRKAGHVVMLPSRLRREDKQLRVERDILLKAAPCTHCS